MVIPWTGALQRSGVSLHLYPDRGEGSFSELANFPEVPRIGGLSTCPTLMVMMELQELLMYVPYLYKWWKLERWPGFSIEIVRSRDCTLVPCNLKIGTPFLDSENAQHNLKIVQIPRLCGTYPPISMVTRHSTQPCTCTLVEELLLNCEISSSSALTLIHAYTHATLQLLPHGGVQGQCADHTGGQCDSRNWAQLRVRREEQEERRGDSPSTGLWQGGDSPGQGSWRRR